MYKLFLRPSIPDYWPRITSSYARLIENIRRINSNISLYALPLPDTFSHGYLPVIIGGGGSEGLGMIRDTSAAAGQCF